jgi:hypothetical protein
MNSIILKGFLIRQLKFLNEYSNLIVAIVTVVAVATGVVALDEYKKTNLAEARSQLYGAENSIAQQEMEREELQRIYVEIPEDVTPQEYIRISLAISMSGNPDFELPKALNGLNSEQLHSYIWGINNFATPGGALLRRLYIHCESYIYHMHNAFDLNSENFIEDGEWDTWRQLLEEIGPNPICLAAVNSAERNQYFSHDFAIEYQNAIGKSELHRSVVSILYPQLLLSSWPDNFPEF